MQAVSPFSPGGSACSEPWSIGPLSTFQADVVGDGGADAVRDMTPSPPRSPAPSRRGSGLLHSPVSSPYTPPVCQEMRLTRTLPKETISMKLQEEKNTVLVTAQVPLFAQDDLTLSVDGPVLTLTAHATRTTSSLNARDHRPRGRRRRSLTYMVHSKASRSLRLPTDVDADHARATFKDHVLTVRLPKASRSGSSVQA